LPKKASKSLAVEFDHNLLEYRFYTTVHLNRKPPNEPRCSAATLRDSRASTIPEPTLAGRRPALVQTFHDQHWLCYDADGNIVAGGMSGESSVEDPKRLKDERGPALTKFIDWLFAKPRNFHRTLHQMNTTAAPLMVRRNDSPTSARR